MSYSRSPPRSPSSQEDWLARGPYSSKTYSTGSSRHGSRSQSVASSSNRGHSSTNYENTARIYYIELKSYLKDLLAQEAIEGPQPQRVTARQKLTRLSNLQFHELAMDVYDEVVRRNKNDKFLPFLAVKEEFHPKRNQARQKLATLPVPRFQDLASDVYTELTRRYTTLIEKDETLPPIPQIPSSSYNSNHGQPSKSANIVPVKGTIAVETVDLESDHSYMSPISPTEPKDYFTRSSPTDNQKENNKAEIERIKSEYDYQISKMTSRIKQLQDQLEDQKNNKTDSALFEKLQKKEDDDQKMIRQMEVQYKRLNEKYDQLDRDYMQQQEAVREVKKETKQMLDELKRLSKVNDELLSEKEKMDNQIQDLKEEVKEWQTKYDKARIELRSIKVSSTIEMDHSNDIIKENLLRPTRDGLISQDNILTYQAYVDDLLLSARAIDPSQVINVMKKIVTVCRSITEEIEDQEVTLLSDTKKSLYELKIRFSSSLSDLLVAAKYHASGMGISPVSLLDRSAGHLTFVIVELVKLLGMTTAVSTKKPTLSSMISSFKDDDNAYQSMKQQGYDENHNSYYSSSTISRSVSNHQKTDRSANNSINYKRSINGDYRRNNHQQDEPSPSDLAKYLKTETDHIVQTIQNLLAALRLPHQNGEVYSIINTIIKIVNTISELSRATCSSPRGYAYKSECDPVLNELGKSSQRISMIQAKYFARGSIATATVKRDLAKEAYEIAKYTKELISLFESNQISNK